MCKNRQQNLGIVQFYKGGTGLCYFLKMMFFSTFIFVPDAYGDNISQYHRFQDQASKTKDHTFSNAQFKTPSYPREQGTVL